MSRKAVIFLQNAWSPHYSGRLWPRVKWLRALQRSRSGQRLATLTSECPDVELWYDNTTPRVGGHPDSVLAPDPKHILRVLENQKPDMVVALGRFTALAVKPIGDQPLLIAPHPAYRLLTNELYKEAGRILQSGFDGVIELQQGKGEVKFLFGGERGQKVEELHVRRR